VNHSSQPSWERIVAWFVVGVVSLQVLAAVLLVYWCRLWCWLLSLVCCVSFGGTRSCKKAL
jgi:hypothetical protein